MNAEILAVGTEILLGDIVNTNSQYIARELAESGVGVYYQTVVGDNPERMKRAMYEAFSRADIVITTGGLGPTADDLTKEMGAEYFGKKLILDERSLKRLKNFFNKLNKTMTDNNVKQAYVPEGSIVMYNQNGTAPGIIIEENGKILIMLPGPPKEMVPMFDEQVKPFLKSKQEYTLVSRVLRVSELGESTMESMVRDIIDESLNPTVAPYAKNNESLLRITARAKSNEEAEKLIEPVADEIYRRLGDNIYAEGETNISQVVAKALLESGKTISVSESCTGGLLASAFIDNSGISEVFMEGAVTYSNEAKMNRLGVKKETLDSFGAVSEQVAMEMAEGIAKTARTNIGMSTTGVAGPDGGTEEKPVGLVYIGLYIDGKIVAKKFNFAGSRERIRSRAVAAALNWLRLELNK